MNIKYVALINIAGIVFSSFTPALASIQSERLNEREKRLTEQAVRLADKDVNLDDTERELNRKKAELDDFAKKMHDEKVELSVRAVEIDDTMAKLNYDSEKLAAQNQEFLNDKAEFEDFRASVVRQSEEAERTMNEANEKLKLVKAREDEVLNSARELKAREDKLAEETEQLNLEKAELMMSDKKLDEREKDFAQREERLNIAQKNIEDEKKKLEGDWEKVNDERRLAEKTRKDASIMMEEAEEKARKADAIIAENDSLMSRIGQLNKDLEAKTRELNELISRNQNNHVELAIDGGTLDWSKGLVRAKGMGIAPPNKTKAQGKALARRAAVADLQRNLLETIQGVQIDSKTKIIDHMTESDVITTAVNGTIRGVEIIREDYDEDEQEYIIEGQIQQDKLSNVMSKILADMTIPNRPKETRVKTGGEFTGLIIDARNLAGLQERKAMRIVDEKGIAVYGVEFADKNVFLKAGLCEYYNNIVFKENEARVGDNPLVIEAQRLSNSNEDIVIPMGAAEEIRNNKIDFRKDCKVIVVKS